MTDSTAQADMNDKLRNHGLPTPKEAETAEPMSAEERAQKLTRICLDYWELDDPEFEDNYALDIAEQIRQAEQAARAHERRKALEEAEMLARRPIMRFPNEPWPEYVERCRQVILERISNLTTSSEPGEDT